ncbi:hypothetical protein DWC19_25155 [Streptomyces sp. M7]|nr:hypothetical protein DWC19_25155 [Streptomyces sp. M7]
MSVGLAAVVAAWVQVARKARALWLLAEHPASDVALRRAGVSELQAVAEVWPAVQREAAVPEVGRAWVVWAGPELVLPAEAALAPVVAEHSRSLVVEWWAQPRELAAKVQAAVQACTVAVAEHSAGRSQAALVAWAAVVVDGPGMRTAGVIAPTTWSRTKRPGSRKKNVTVTCPEPLSN